MGPFILSDDTDKLRLEEEERHLVVQADWLGASVPDLQLPITCYAILLAEVCNSHCEFCHRFDCCVSAYYTFLKCFQICGLILLCKFQE